MSPHDLHLRFTALQAAPACRISPILACVLMISPQIYGRAAQDTNAPQNPLSQSGSKTQSSAQGDLTQLSIENLMSVEVTSVSKKEQTLSRTAAAIFVITPEDIQRSGAVNIPDLLRMVPGVEVAQINANTWAISARGLNGEFSNELLVTMDGRNMYTPTFGGVFWDVLDFPLEDIERIEVIRGPGGSIWGANAVNGVINIITKKASETKGVMVVAGGGNLDEGFGTTQYGGSAGQKLDFRVYAKYFNQNHMPGLTGQDGGDGWHILRGGFRADSTLSPKDTLTVQGDLYAGKEGSPTTVFPSLTAPALVDTVLPVNLSGGFVQGTWNHASSERSSMTVVGSYEGYERENQLGETRKTVNVEFQQHIAWGSRQDFVWGLEYGGSDSDSHGDLLVSVNQRDITSHLFSSFVQDEVSVIPEHFYLTAGTKLQRSYYTGFGLMPSIRATYALNARHMVWAAVSRALRTPSDLDASIRQNSPGPATSGGVPVILSLLGNRAFKNEGLVAYELGYRTAANKNLSLDFTAFYHDYGNQQTVEPIAPFLEPTPPPAHLVLPSTYENLGHGEAYGVEVAAQWKVTDRWILSPGYDFQRIHMKASPPSADQETPLDDEGGDPHVQAQLRSHLEVSKSLRWDASAYFVDRLMFDRIPSYTRVDSGLTWRWTEGLALSLVGQNLVRDHHVEFADSPGAARATQIKRSAYAKVTWQF